MAQGAVVTFNFAGKIFDVAIFAVLDNFIKQRSAYPLLTIILGNLNHFQLVRIGSIVLLQVGRFTGWFASRSGFFQPGITNRRGVIIDPEDQFFTDKGGRQNIYYGLLLVSGIHLLSDPDKKIL